MENRETRKRVVLRHMNGLHRIVGQFDPSIHKLREFVTFDDSFGHPIAAAFVSEQAHFVLYKEVTKFAGLDLMSPFRRKTRVQ